jgi:hypothetical protein
MLLFQSLGLDFILDLEQKRIGKATASVINSHISKNTEGHKKSFLKNGISKCLVHDILCRI